MWITYDVANLYSSIPHKLDIDAVNLYFEHYTSLTSDVRMFVLGVLQYLLTHNYFVFNGDTTCRDVGP